MPGSIESSDNNEDDITNIYDNEGIEQDSDVQMINIADGDFGNPNNGSDDELLLTPEEDTSRKNFKKPIWFCRFVAEWPSVAFGLGIAGHIFIVATTVTLLHLGYDVFPTNFEELPVNMENQPWIKRDLAWRRRDSYSHKLVGIKFPVVATGQDFMEIVISAKSGNVLTKSMMDDMKKFESQITSLKHYDDYCHIQPSSKKCIPPNSIQRLFDGSLSSIDPIFNDPNFTKIPQVLYTALQNNITNFHVKYALPKDTNITQSHAFAGMINLLRSDEVFTSTLEHNSVDFSDSPITPCDIFLVWGIKEQDLSNCYFGDYKCRGIQRYDDDFNPNSQEAQISFQKLCNKLFSMTTEEIKKYRIQIDHKTGLPKIKCFARDIDKYLQQAVPPTVFDARLPWDLEKTKKVIGHVFPEYYNVFNITPSYDEYLNAAFNLWTLGNYVQNNTEVLKGYDTLIGQMESPFTKTIVSNPEIKVGNKFRYVAISIETDINGFYMGFEEGIPLIEAWEGFMKDQLSTMPKSLQKGFQISPYGTWNWIYAQREIQRNAITGVILGLCLTTVILVISIHNIITSLLAALTICIVTVCVIGTLPIIGWKLGKKSLVLYY
ncbi:hypothetical protein LOTGIDRAFT_167395 [Lottia gigantea]|uniref:SSD domain-containing protein n=1 Tax=Lottia gigantea TaxID=225164 RepID=V3ZP97_LOTGI|nr:hypothetical protein LOTGIDRAFT_167395 [Lottia gigantea]ESO86162.1 hypothetical protein LOTGIDRAFT_167395 [Lottia gigantea]